MPYTSDWTASSPLTEMKILLQTNCHDWMFLLTLIRHSTLPMAVKYSPPSPHNPLFILQTNGNSLFWHYLHVGNISSFFTTPQIVLVKLYPVSDKKGVNMYVMNKYWLASELLLHYIYTWLISQHFPRQYLRKLISDCRGWHILTSHQSEPVNPLTVVL